MPTPFRRKWAMRLSIVASGVLSACGGGGSADPAPSATAPLVTNPAASPPATPPVSPPVTPPPGTGAVTLKPPDLSLTDTGLSVTDGITRNGLWSVSSDGLAWEFSMDMGVTWTLGTGSGFEVTGDGPKTIWVRSRDDFGNRSAVVVVTCVLDTMAPAPVTIGTGAGAVSRTLDIMGLEPGARWEYSIDAGATWRAGTGASLGVLGNALARVSLRQIDRAGNASMAQPVMLEQAGGEGWHEASGNPLQPSVFSSNSRTLLIHGSVVRGDADYVRWDVPMGFRMSAVRLIHYQSADLIAFYALQLAAVFDAGVDVNRMLVYGHMGPPDLGVNVLATTRPELLGAGPVTLWFQQTGSQPTAYAIEVTLDPTP